MNIPDLLKAGFLVGSVLQMVIITGECITIKGHYLLRHKPRRKSYSLINFVFF